MPDFYNVIRASSYIGADPKTVRNWLKQGRITGTRTPRGWLAIPEDQVERMRVEWANERAKFAVPTPPHASPVSTAKLEGRIAELEAIVATQNERISALELALSNPSLPIPISPYQSPPPPQPPLHRYTTDREEAVTRKPSIRPSQPSQTPVDIPEGSMLFADFAKLHNVNRATFYRHCTQGIQGDHVETIERAKPGGRQGDIERWLTPDQQSAAIAFWERHGVRFNP